ncbi:MAG: hypothetical protein RIF41_15090 [Polyangiaceae bacterium]
MTLGRILACGWLALTWVGCATGPPSATPDVAAKCIPRPLGHPPCGSQCPSTFPGHGTSCSPLYGDCRYTNGMTCGCEGVTSSALAWTCRAR